MNPNQTPNQTAGNRGGKLARFRLPALVVAIILVTVGTLAVVKRGNSKVEEKPAAPAVLEFAAADVIRVEQRELVLAIPLSGSLAPVVQSTVKAKVSGELLTVLVREGEQVKQGQVLAEVDTGDLRATRRPTGDLGGSARPLADRRQESR